jgi:hypothetical protein
MKRMPLDPLSRRGVQSEMHRRPSASNMSPWPMVAGLAPEWFPLPPGFRFGRFPLPPVYFMVHQCAAGRQPRGHNTWAWLRPGLAGLVTHRVPGAGPLLAPFLGPSYPVLSVCFVCRCFLVLQSFHFPLRAVYFPSTGMNRAGQKFSRHAPPLGSTNRAVDSALVAGEKSLVASLDAAETSARDQSLFHYPISNFQSICTMSWPCHALSSPALPALPALLGPSPAVPRFPRLDQCCAGTASRGRQETFPRQPACRACTE